jgi:hypothetical protein
MRRGAAFVAVTAALLAVPATASATKRYVSPTGSGVACTQAAPCSLATGIGVVAGPLDDIFVPGNLGDYNQSAPIAPTNDSLRIHGTNGRPRIVFSAGGLDLTQSESAFASGLRVESTSASTAFLIGKHGSAANIIATNNAGGSACDLHGVLDPMTGTGAAALVNSVCWSSGNGAFALRTEGVNSIRNVTAIASGTNGEAIHAFAQALEAGNDELVNVIARGGAGGHDLTAESDNTADATIHATYSNFANTFTTGSGSPAKTHITVDSTDQNAAPVFVNAPGGDFHEVAASPTVNAGLSFTPVGETDFDGDPRTIGSATDIGADELPQRPTVTTESAEDVNPTGATIRGTVNANGRTTFYWIQYGTSTSYGQSTPMQSVPADGAIHLVTHDVTGLRPMTTYHFRLVALNAVGPALGTDLTFTTGDAFTGAVVKSKTAKEKSGRLKIKVLCPTGTPGSCVGRLLLKSASKVSVNGHRKTLTIGRSSFNIAPSTSSRTVSVTVLATALDYLHRHGKLTATAIATSHDSFGTTKSNRRTVKLTATKQH